MAKKKTARKKGAKKGIIIAAAAVAVVLAAIAGCGIYVTGTDTIYKGVSVDGTPVGGLTRQEALSRLQELGWDNADASVTVLLPLERSVTVTAAEAGAAVSASDAAIAAYNYGHDGNIISNLVTYLKSAAGGTDVALTPEVNENIVREKVDAAVADVTAGLMASGVEIGENSVLVVKGAKAVIIDEDDVCSLITTAIRERNYGEIEYKVEVGEAVEMNVNELYDSIFKEPADAYYDAETGEVADAVAGIDFDKEEAQRLWDEASVGDTVEIPLIVTEPELTTETLQGMLFRDELATATTSLSGSSQNRIDNVKLAADTISGTVLKPGETFSYNGTLGQRTAERGFKLAGAYSGGQVVQEIGGGICQVSSTIYYCTLLANLKIVDRTCHYFPVGYLPAGLDATVSWKSPDFKFTNDRDYPIRIEAAVNSSNNTLTVRILGTDVDGSYVQMTYASWLVYNNAAYPNVATGYKAATYRWVYDKNGGLISKNLEAYSEYHYHDEDIAIPSPSPTPSATPTPTPSPSASPGATPSATPSETPEVTSPTDTQPTPPPATTPVG